MARRIATLALSILVAAASLGAAGIDWRPSLAAARDEARLSGKLLMVDVYTDWCTWCKKLDSEAYVAPAVVALSASFVPLKINPEKDAAGAAFVEKLGVSGYPTVLFLEPDGALAYRIGGYLPAKDFADKMRLALDYRSKLGAYSAEYGAGKYGNAPEYLSMLCELGRIDEAEPIFDRLKASLGAAQRAESALAIAESLVDSEQYGRAMPYLALVESAEPGSDKAYEAYFYHAAALFYTAGKAKAMEYLDGLLGSKQAPETWKARYEDMKARMGRAK
jgi:thiol-disulfide isomerase/thioredoxin